MWRVPQTRQQGRQADPVFVMGPLCRDAGAGPCLLFPPDRRAGQGVTYTRSKTVAMPWPRPIHMVATPRVASFSSIRLIRVVEIRAPEQPRG